MFSKDRNIVTFKYQFFKDCEMSIKLNHLLKVNMYEQTKCRWLCHVKHPQFFFLEKHSNQRKRKSYSQMSQLNWQMKSKYQVLNFMWFSNQIKGFLLIIVYTIYIQVKASSQLYYCYKRGKITHLQPQTVNFNVLNMLLKFNPFFSTIQRPMGTSFHSVGKCSHTSHLSNENKAGEIQQ